MHRGILGKLVLALLLTIGVGAAVADSLGTISIGKVADLVLLDADPTLDVANARRVRAVFVQGRYLDRPALDTLLARAARTLTANPLPAAH